MGIKMCSINSITFGLPANDAFGVAVLLEFICTITNLAFVGEILTNVALEELQKSWRFLGEVILYAVSGVPFPCLILLGFILLKKHVALKIWIIVGITIDLALIFIMTSLALVDEKLTTNVIISLIVFIFAVITFRGYVYLLGWNAWSEVARGLELKGYTQGFLNIFKYYQNEFKRAALILLVVEFTWNLFAIFSIDFEWELETSHLNQNGVLIPGPIIPLRVMRSIIALFGLICMYKEKYSCLKFGWMTCQLVSIFTGILVPILLATVSNDTSQHVPFVSLFSIECAIHTVINGILLIVVIQFISHFQPQMAPRRFVSVETDA